jgi:ORF6N domain
VDKKKNVAIPIERIENRILLARGHKVLLDADLAALYRVETRVLNQAVKRNAERFPPDFMFRLSTKEFANWRSQVVMSNPAAKMALRRAPFKRRPIGFVTPDERKR